MPGLFGEQALQQGLTEYLQSKEDPLTKYYTNIHGLRKETGFAFVWILFILAIISGLGLAFLQKVSIGTAATETRFGGIQAHYMAESAANHALWRLLNDPEFNPSETVYYMHELSNGRYGYKVRKPTLTKFGTVATVGGVSNAVGGVSNAVTNQSYVQYLKPYDIITAYGRMSDQLPDYRRLLGASWVDAAETVDIGSTVKWLVLQGSPQKKEMIMGTLDVADDINLAVWDGTTWSDLSEFSTISSDAYRCLDIAYENLSGEALVVGRYATGDARYNIWDGNAWVHPTAQTDATFDSLASLYYVDMASRPNSDEILIAMAQWKGDLDVAQWDGSSLIDHGEIEGSMENNEVGGVEIVYEQQSGDALVLWGRSGEHQVYYAVWSGASLSPVPLLIPYDFGNDIQMVRAAADPTSDYIFVGAVNDDEDLDVAVWNGDVWIDSRKIETSGYAYDEQIFDIAWEHSGEEVIIAWAPDSGNNVRYFKWPKGTALAGHSVQNGPDFQSAPHLVRLLSIGGTEKIILLVKNEADALRYSLWTGNTFLGDPALLLDASIDWGGFKFDIAESGVTYTGGSG